MTKLQTCRVGETTILKTMFLLETKVLAIHRKKFMKNVLSHL